MQPRIHVAVAVVCRGTVIGGSTKVLIARRPGHKHQGGLLEFPGGKVEPGETVQAALVRELAEEVGLEADPRVMSPLIQIVHDYADKQVLLDVWQVPVFTGSPKGLEGQPIQWLAVDDLKPEQFPAANGPIIRALRLPREWLITGYCPDSRILDDNIERARNRGRRFGIVLRQPALAAPAYLNLAKAALDLCQRHRIPLMLHGDPAVLEAVPGATGVHVPHRLLANSDLRKILAQGKWLGVSCHSAAELARAAELGAHYAFVSPVRPTLSHPGQEALGWECFSEWTRTATLPVYALGGMQESDIERSRNHGGQGIAGISHWWRV